MVRNILLYNHQHADFPMTAEQMEQYVPKSLVYSILWSFAGDAKMKVRHVMSDFVRSITTIPLPPITTVPIIDFEECYNWRVSPNSVSFFCPVLSPSMSLS